MRQGLIKIENKPRLMTIIDSISWLFHRTNN